jgi:hypothetical protein
MILHRGGHERSKQKPYAIGWEGDRRDVVASFDTLSRTVPCEAYASIADTWCAMAARLSGQGHRG